MRSRKETNSQTPLSYCEMAILQLNQVREELQEELKDVKRFKSNYENLQTELQEAKGEIDSLKRQLEIDEDSHSNLEYLTKNTADNERNINYLYQNIKEIRTDLEKAIGKISQDNDENLRQEILELKRELQLEREKTNQAQKIIERLSKDIISNQSLHYRKLERYLITKRWDKADVETFVKIQELVGRVGYSRLQKEDLDRFSCDELHFIEQLWLKHSRGHFGLSVQKKIYQSLGGETNIDRDVWKKFGKQVGWYRNHRWIRYGDVKFSLDAPSGHLPARVWDAWNNGGVGSFDSLMSVLLRYKSW